MNIKILQNEEIRRQNRKRGKTMKSMVSRYYNFSSILGNNWARFFILVGAGDIGKSYAVMNHILRAKFRNPLKHKLFWTRLTDTAAQKLLSRNADHLVDPDLYRKFKKTYKTKGNTVFYGESVTDTKGKTSYVNQGELLQIHSLSTFFNNKGEALFDNEFNGEYWIVLDEMNREAGEANRFSIVEAFANQLENFCRDTKAKVRVIMIGNNISELSDVMASFSFIPRDFGRFKLKRKKCVIDVIKPNAAYTQDRKESVGYLLDPNAKRFTEKLDIDESFVAEKKILRLSKPVFHVAFSKNKKDWFTFRTENIFSKYDGSEKPIYGLVQYLGFPYSKELVRETVEAVNGLTLKYENYAIYIHFLQKISKIKS